MFSSVFSMWGQPQSTESTMSSKLRSLYNWSSLSELLSSGNLFSQAKREHRRSYCMRCVLVRYRSRRRVVKSV
jgi:hypothetical protein